MEPADLRSRGGQHFRADCALVAGLVDSTSSGEHNKSTLHSPPPAPLPAETNMRKCSRIYGSQSTAAAKRGINQLELMIPEYDRPRFHVGSGAFSCLLLAKLTEVGFYFVPSSHGEINLDKNVT